jgi:hypothetical protein
MEPASFGQNGEFIEAFKKPLWVGMKLFSLTPSASRTMELVMIALKRRYTQKRLSLL